MKLAVEIGIGLAVFTVFGAVLLLAAAEAYSAWAEWRFERRRARGRVIHFRPTTYDRRPHRWHGRASRPTRR